MNKSHYNRFFHRKLTNQSTIDKFTDIIRCKKCNKYNNINFSFIVPIPNISIYYCIFCNKKQKI